MVSASDEHLELQTSLRWSCIVHSTRLLRPSVLLHSGVRPGSRRARPKAHPDMKQSVPKLLAVGAFPPPSTEVRGGQVTTGRAVMGAEFSARFAVRFIDSTQKTNPPPPLLVRGGYAALRLIKFAWEVLVHRPSGVLLFATVGPSYVEKGCMSVLARLLRIPSILFLRGGNLIHDFDRSRIQRWLMKALLTHADRFLCQGPSWQSFAVDKLGYSVESSPIIPNWTATEALLRIGRKRVPQPHPRRARVLFVGWLERAKGVEDLVIAARLLKESGLDFELSVVGDGHSRGWLEAFVREHSLEDCVRFLGWKSPEEVRSHLACNDIFVLPSWGEGMPNALIEAMASRLACVCSRVGMVPDFLLNGTHALLTAARDPQELGEALKLLIEDAALRQSLADRAFELAEEVFSERLGVKRFADAVEVVIRQPRDGATVR